MKLPKPDMLIYAKWMDHCCYSGWCRADRTEPRVPTTVEIVGWIIKADNDTWEITAARAFDDEGGIQSVDNVHVIIANQITEWQEIKG